MAWSIFTDGGGDPVAAAWAKQLLQMIGAPVTPGNEQFIYDWEKSEGGGGKYNPLNQGPVPGNPTLTTTGSQYGGGAADYASWAAGLQGAVDFLNMSNYTAVLSNLKANNPVGARTALWASPWASSHYGYGADWSNAPLPGTTATVLPAALTTGSASTTGNSSTGNPCAFNISLSVLGNDCLLSMTEARATIAGLMLMVGTTVFCLGSIVLVGYGLKSSGAGKAATTAASFIPGAGAVVGAANAAKKTTAKKTATKKTTGAGGP